MTDTDQHDRLSGADLARTALRAARRSARDAGNAPAKRKKPLAVADRRGRDAREPARLDLVVPALASSQGWALGMAGGSIQDRWAAIVGPDAATHWAPAGFDTTTRTLRVLVDSPAWATQLRLRTRQVLALLDQQLAPGSVRALDVRVANKPAAWTEHDDQAAVPARHAQPAPCPARPPLADQAAYRQLRRQMREQAVARQVALGEAAADRDADRDKWFRGHRGWLREPEEAQPTAVEASRLQEAADRAHAREQLARHHAALAAARAERAGAVPLRPIRKPASLTGAA